MPNSKLSTVFKSNKIQYGIVLLLLLPILFINITDYQGWGGDFAQYIQQGINIAHGEVQNQSNYIFNPANNYLAPPSYPSGFPLLLSPIILLFGSSIFALKIYISALLILVSLLFFKFLKHFFSFKLALFSTLIFVYNPWVLDFKQHIISDIPFLLFFLAGINTYINFKNTKRKVISSILIGFFIGYSMLIKNIGIIILPAMFLDLFVHYFRSTEKNKRLIFIAQLKYYFISVASCFTIYILVNNILFPEKTELYGFFFSLFDFSQLGNIWLLNAENYILNFEAFFYPETRQFHFIPLIYKAFALTFLVIGFFQKIIKHPGFLELVFVAYLAIVFSFPNYSQGLRYLFPIIPIIFYYIIIGLKSIQFKKEINTNYYILSLLFITIFLYKTEIATIANRKHVEDGPFSTEALETFDFIKNNTDESAIFIFTKPRVLGLYSERLSLGNNPTDNLKTTEKQLKDYNWKYILRTSELRDNAIDSFIFIHKNELDTLYLNSSFVLYQLIE